MAKPKGSKDLKFIDKIKYYYRVWQEERAEDERQAIEHDYIPDMNTRVAAKFHILKNQFGENIINDGLEIYEIDKLLKKHYNDISFTDIQKMKKEIECDPNLSAKLNNARYNPKSFKQSTKEFVLYQAVFSNMVETEMYKKFSQQNETSNSLDEIA